MGFCVFTLIGVANTHSWMDTNIHLQIIAAGFILLIIGILSMIFFYKQGEKTKKEYDEASDLSELSYNLRDRSKDKVKWGLPLKSF